MVTSAQISTAIKDYEDTPVEERTHMQLCELIDLTQEGLRQVRPVVAKPSPRWAATVLRRLRVA